MKALLLQIGYLPGERFGGLKPGTILLALAATLFLAGSGLAANRIWSGGAISNDFWSDPDNWSGGVAPGAGDALIFPAGIQLSDRGTRNNLGNTIFLSLRFDGEDYSVTGDTVRVSGGVTAFHNVAFNTGIQLMGDQTFGPIQFTGGLDFESNADLDINGFTLTILNNVFNDSRLVGGGSVIVEGRLDIYRPSSFTGPITVRNGGTVYVTAKLDVLPFGTLGSTAGATFVGQGGQLFFRAWDDETVLETLHLDAGSSVRLERALFSLGSGTITLGAPIILGGTGVRTISCANNVFGEGITTHITSRISGSGDLQKEESQTLFIEGTLANTFGGSFTATGGLTVLAKPAGLAALSCADVMVSNSSLRLDANEQIVNTARLHLLDAGTFNLNGKTETVASLEMRGGVASGNSPSLFIVAGNVTSLASANSAQINVNSRVLGVPTVLDVEDGAAVDDLAFTVSLNGAAGSSLRKTGAGRANIVEFTGNRPVEIQGGTLVLGSAAGSAVTLNGGTLAGDSAVGSLTSAAGGGTIAPGLSVGTISCTTVTLNAATTFAVEIQSATAGGFDLLDANLSTVNLGGATLAVTLLPGFDAGIGAPITILDNDGTDAIVGTFAGLPENAEVVLSGARFRISYIGGTGNDVTLSLTSVTPTLVTRTWTGNAASSGTDQASNWSPVSVPQAGDTLLFPAGPADKVVVDNIAGSTPYHRLDFQEGGYTMGGSGIALVSGIKANYASGDTQLSLPLRLTANLGFTADIGAKLIVSGPGIAAVNLDGHALSVNVLTPSSAIDFGVDSAGLNPIDGIFGAGSSGGAVVKFGVGTARMKCANSYTGVTSVRAGVIAVQNGLGLGATGAGNETIVDAGAALALVPLAGTVISVPEDVTLNGSLQSFDTNGGPGVVNTLSGTITLPDTRTFQVFSGQLALSGVVQGAGAPLLNNGGELSLTGTAANTFSGQATVVSGILSLQKPVGVAAIGSAGVLASGVTSELRLLATDQITGDVTVQNGATFHLNSFNETVPRLLLRNGNVTGPGTLTLDSKLVVTAGSTATSTVSAGVRASGATLELDVLDTAVLDDLVLSGAITSAAGGATLLKRAGGGRAVLGGVNTIANLQLDTGAAIVTGNSSAMAVQLNGGTLGGTGTVGAITSSAPGGTVAPGASTGILNSGAVTWNAATHFAVELTTPTPGSGHDQLNVTGAVNLGGAQLDVTTLAGFSATPADTFIILANDGADAITGTFAGLAQNATFSVAGKTFRISYIGGSGNDVTLKLFTLGTGITRTWDGGGADNNWTTPANWDGNVTAPSAGDNLVFSLFGAQRTNTNNFAANTTFNSIKIEGFGYLISGAAVVLNDGLTFELAASSLLLPITLSQAQTFTALSGAVGTVNPSTTLTNNGFPLTLHADSATARLIVSDLAGSGALRKTGVGGATLATNTHTGVNEFLEGEVLLEGVVTGLGTGAAGSIVAVDATLRLNAIAATTVTPPLTLGGELAFVNSPVTFSGGVSLSGSDAGVVEVTGAGIPILSGAISGAGGLRKTGTGELTISGASSNTFTGGLFVEAGVLRAQKSVSSGLAPGPVTIGDGTATAAELRYLTANQLPSILVTLNGAGAHFNLGNLAETISSLAMTGGTVSAGGSPATQLILSSGSVTTFASATPATLNGNINATSTGVRFWNIADGAAADDLVIGGSITSVAGFVLVKRDEGRVVFAGNSSFPKLRLEIGTAAFTGSGPTVAVELGSFGNNQATLTGNGFTGAITTPTVIGGNIAPSGILTATGNTSWNAETRFQIHLLNTTPGTGHDQLAVLGTPTLGDAQLEITAQPGLVTAFGDSFKIIDNNGSADPVVGTFAGLPEGTLIDVSGYLMRISYIGGDGNDVVLTTASLPATNVTRVWDGGDVTDGNWTRAANWVGDIAPVAGDALDFPETAARKSNTNTFPANTTFDSIRISGSGYTIAGTNAIVLNAGFRAETGIATVSFSPPLVLASAQTFFQGASTSPVFETGAAIATNGQTLTLDCEPGVTTLRGVISGSGSLVKTGLGAVFLSGNNTFTGSVDVQTGSVQMNHDNALGATSGATTVQTGATLGVNTFVVAAPENITLFGTITSFSGATQFTGTLTLPGPASGSVVCNGTLDLAGLIAGPGSLMKSGPADLTFSGASANTFTGGFVLNTGTARLQKTAGLVALPGPVWVGDGTGADELQLLNANQIADTATVAIVKGGTFNLNNLSETIGAIELTEGTVSTGTGTLTLDGTLETFAAANTATITGKLAVKAPAAGTRTWTIADGAATDDLTMNAVVSSTPTSVKLEMSGSGRTRFTAANTISDIILSGGTAIFTGANTGTSITLDGGTLGGTGTISDIFADTGGGIVAPGLSPGILSAASKVIWNPRTTFAVELSTLATYDRLNAEGPIALDDATLNLSLGFTPQIGQTFLILRNTGSDPITGQFAGKPQGAFLSAPGAHIFQITYTGNDGNDVELTRVAGIPLTLTSFTKVPGTGPNLGQDVVTITGAGTPGLTYQLETSIDLVTWQTHSDQSANTITGVLNFQFPQPPNIPKMFYRLRLP